MLNSVKNQCLREINPPEEKRKYSTESDNKKKDLMDSLSMLDSKSSWCPWPYENSWIKLDLGEEMDIKGIIIQGRKDFNSFLKTYEVEYSTNDNYYIDTKKTYKGAEPHYGEKRFYDYVPFPFKARYIKIYPKTWKTYLGIRVGILVNSESTTDRNSCIPVQNNFVYNNQKGIIEKCNPMCESCIERADKCLKCKDGLHKLKYPKFYQRDKCYSLAPFPGHYVDNSTSLITPIRSNRYRIPRHQINTFYNAQRGIMEKCDPMCKTCIERADKCLKCKDGLHKLKYPNFNQRDKCYSLAPFPGHYVDNSTSLITPKRNHKNCIPPPQNNHFYNTQRGIMEKCDPMCKTCIERPDKCLKCQKGLYKLKYPNFDQRDKCYSLASFPNSRFCTMFETPSNLNSNLLARLNRFKKKF